MEKSSNTTPNVWGKEPSMEGWNNIQKTERELQWCQICEMSTRISINGEERWICNGTQNCNGEALREMFDKNGSCPSYRPQPEQQFNRELNAIQEQWGTQACREVIENWKKIGTALKPSFEPIIVARKPFKGSLVDNVIEYGVGGINIDECRVGMSENDKQEYYNKQKSFNNMENQVCGDNVKFNVSPLQSLEERTKNMNLGRFPANTILTYDETDFEEVCGGFPNTKGSPNPRKNTNRNIYGDYKSVTTQSNIWGDSGSASRYFYCAKASKKDRDEGLEEFETKSHAEINNRKEGSAGATRQYGGGTNPFLSVSCPRKNTHPTVKPTELMQYLVRLVTPNGGTILDPFNGSGSTGKAVMYENKEHNKNYKYIGIELTEEYLPISKARIEYVCKLNEEQLKEVQMTIFDL